MRTWWWIAVSILMCLCLVACGTRQTPLERVDQLLQRAEYEEVITLCTEIIAAHPDSVEAYLRRGSAYYYTAGSNAATDRALADFEKAMELAPEHPRGYIGRARIYELRHFFEWETKWQINAQNRRDMSAEEHAKLVDELLAVSSRAVEDYDQAIRLASKALEINPQDAKSYYYRAIAHYDLREYEEAVSDLSKALEIDPDDERAYLVRGLAYTKQKDYEPAIQDHTRAVQLAPEFAVAYVARGNAYLSAMNAEQALADYERALEINPEYKAAEGARTLALIAMAVWP